MFPLIPFFHVAALVVDMRKYVGRGGEMRLATGPDASNQKPKLVNHWHNGKYARAALDTM